MIDDSRQYTMSDIVKDSGWSPPWIRKIEKKLNLKDRNTDRRQGSKKYFSKEYHKFCRHSGQLRRLGFGIKKIKEIFQKEQEIFEYAKKHFSYDSSSNKDIDIKTLVLRVVPTLNFYLTPNVFTERPDFHFDSIKYAKDKKHRNELVQMYTEYKQMLSCIMEKLKDERCYLDKDIEELKKMLK